MKSLKLCKRTASSDFKHSALFFHGGQVVDLLSKLGRAANEDRFASRASVENSPIGEQLPTWNGHKINCLSTADAVA